MSNAKVYIQYLKDRWHEGELEANKLKKKHKKVLDKITKKDDVR